MTDEAIGVSAEGRALLIELARESGPGLCVLLDDSGCCGPGNVFVQSESPQPSYRFYASVAGIPVYADPAFVRDARPSEVRLDVRSAPRDDSASLESRHGVRLVVAFVPRRRAPSEPVGA